MNDSRNADAWLVDGVLHGGDKGVGASLLRGVLTPLAWLHQAGLEAYLTPFRTGLRKRYHLPVPVVCVGNLSSGGTGKTPATALVAGYLRDAGKKVVILSRGHGGAAERGSDPVVISDGVGERLPPSVAGDEPALLAGLLPDVPVVVCRDRRKSGRLAVDRFAPDVILMDDGLQYWQLHRDLDIVLLDARQPFDNGRVLPRGLLREPPSHLSRAGIVILTRADRVGDIDALAQTVARVRQFAAKGVPVLTATHAPVGWVRAGEPNQLLPLASLSGGRAFVFSGIADGNAFVETVRGLGIEPARTRSFGDHHDYTSADVEALRGAAREGLTLLTTEKDAVKIAAFGGETVPNLYALRIALRVSDEAVLRQSLQSVLRD